MRKIFIVCFFMVICFSVYAQQQRDSVKYRPAKFILKWSPLHMLAHFPTFQIAFEHKLSEKFSVQYDFGPVMNFGGLQIKTDTDKHGYKVKLQVRSYMPSSSPHWSFFFGPELFYNRLNFKTGETYIVENGHWNYYEYILFDRKYREKGFGFNGGAVFSVYRFRLDLQLGVAARFIKLNSINRPDAQTYTLVPKDDSDFPFNVVQESNNLISPTGCVRICYIIK